MSKKNRHNSHGYGYGGSGSYDSYGSYGGYGYGWQKTTVSDLQMEMAGTTAVFGRDKRISVKFDGDKAETTEHGVTFPQLDPSLEINNSTLKLFRGWVDSESALARFSDRAFIEGKAKLQQQNPQLYDVFKAVETSRVENSYTEFYQGAGKNLAQLSETMFRKGQEVFKDEKDFYATAISMFSRGRMPGVFNTHLRAEMGKHVDSNKVYDWVDEIEHLDSTEDSFELAQRIIEIINEEKSEEEEKPEEGPGKGKSGERISVDDLMNDAVKEMIKENDFKSEYKLEDEDGPYIPYTVEYDQFQHWAKDDWHEDVKQFVEAKEGMDAELATAKRKLELMIQATQKISWDSMKERGRLDSKRLVGAYQGESNVFKIKRDESDLDTTVSICVDLSGSMRENEKSRYAFLATIVLCELLSKIGVPYEIIGFDASVSLLPAGKKKQYEDLASDKQYIYGRVDAIRMHEFKKFGDRLFDARKYLYRIAELEGSGHNNADGESVKIAATRLGKRPEKRKILFVLSDGLPMTHGNRSRQKGFLKRTVKDIERKMEVIGIGLQSDAVSRFYADHIVLRDVEKLPTTMLDLLGKKLLPQEKMKKTS